ALDRLGRGTGQSDVGAVLLTGNFPSAWVSDELASALGGKFLALCETLDNRLVAQADVILPAATWLEKAGSFMNADGRLQAFEQAIPTLHEAKAEAQIALDLLAVLHGEELTRLKANYNIYMVDEGPGQVPAATD